MPGATVPLGFTYPVGSDPLNQYRTLWQQFAEQVDDYLAALAAVAPVAWTDVTLAGTFAHLGTAAGLGYTERSQYARGAGEVVLTLAQSKATASVANETICSVPVGFRPSRPIRFSGEYNATLRGAYILPDGNVKLSSAYGAGSAGIVGTVSYRV